MKRENKAYSFKEQIIELELQEARYFGISIINKEKKKNYEFNVCLILL